MALSDVIANIILEMMNNAEGQAEIQRNELAEQLGCVPSQINYVLTSRFTPEQGYLVESRRGGGGFIKITRVNLDNGITLMHVVNHIGGKIDEAVCRAMIGNLYSHGIIDRGSMTLMNAALSNQSLQSAPPEYRDILRASIFKQMLLTVIQINS